ncbi:MAG TPA: phosphatase PAP2 family protein [Anaerolineae bacterium]|jgi:undecaprenyl-diphosphatase
MLPTHRLYSRCGGPWLCHRYRVWFYNRTWGWGLIVIAVLFGLSRVFGGIHFPLDIVTGAGLGWFSAWLVRRQRSPVEALSGIIEILADRPGLS